MSEITYLGGLHAVQSAVRYDATRVVEVWVDKRRRDARLQRLRSQLESLDCVVHEAESKTLKKLLPDVPHQGVVIAYKGDAPLGADDLDSHLDGLDHEAFLLILDQVQDPHNLGACLRTADAAGVDAVIAPKDRAAGLTPVVHRVSAGAAQTVPFFQVTNLARTLRALRDRGVWLIGAADEAEQSLYQFDFKGPVGICMGAEGKGLRRLTREHCDALISIPMTGQVESLNVSVATGVVLYEALRQRRALTAGQA